MLDALFETAPGNFSISFIDLILSVALAALLGFFVTYCYRLTHRGFHYERSFIVTLVMAPPIIAVIMMVIGSNLALSLGMVGALSIIRFRTVIKDSRDMIFLFLAIAIGLCCGTYNWLVAVVSTGMLCAILCVLYYVQFGTTSHADYVLVIQGHGNKPLDAIRTIVKNHATDARLRSTRSSADSWEIVAELQVLKTEALAEDSLVDALHELKTVEQTSLLAPQLAIPI